MLAKLANLGTASGKNKILKAQKMMNTKVSPKRKLSPSPSEVADSNKERGVKQHKFSKFKLTMLEFLNDSLKTMASLGKAIKRPKQPYFLNQLKDKNRNR